MKKILIFIVGFTIFTLVSCTAQNSISTEQVKNLVENNEFTFSATRAHPTNFDVINVMNSLPAGSSSRILDLDYGYGIVIKNGELVSTLPYFGRMYTPSMDRDKDSYRFTSKDFSIEKSQGKKNSQIITVKPRDLNYVRRIIFEVFPNGKAYVSVDSNDRQPISYDGYLKGNQPEK